MVRRIALVYDARSEFHLKVMGGVAAYFQDRRRFADKNESGALLLQMHDMNESSSWQADGVVADLDDPRTVLAASRSGVPVVGFGDGSSTFSRNSEIPYLFTNNNAIGEMAAAHLLKQGLRQFAYVSLSGCPQDRWDKQREQAFAEYIAERGAEFSVCADREGGLFALGEWLKSLKKPVGVMAANDRRAKEVLECCRLFDFEIPREIAVIGVDNSDLLCRLSWPSLSSVERGASRIGYEAAALLNRMMAGERAPATEIAIEPTHVVVRESTTNLADIDPLVMRAVQFIESHYSKSIKVSDVVNAAGISESVLECRFVKTLGCTIYAAIREARLEHVRRLVSETEVPLKQIAPEAGFSSVQHMTTLFRKAFGQSPARYRRSVAKSKFDQAASIDEFNEVMPSGTAA
jgi:LacI family transcriptional regulator